MERILSQLSEKTSKFLNPENLLPTIKQVIVVIVLFGLLYLIGLFLPVGHDWKYFFSKGVIPSIWVPWTNAVVRYLTLPMVFAITVLAIGLRAYRSKSHLLSFFLAMISLPTLWVLFIGNLDGVVILGLLLLPIGAPLVLLKPQIASFALLARWHSLLVGIFWLLLSFLIWGFWPSNFLVVLSDEWVTEWVQDISLFPWGLVIALPLLWFSWGDEDLLMAAGSLATPHLFPYHFIVLMPALGRMKKSWMVVTWIISWTPLLANWFGNKAWHFGNLLSICFWAGIYLNTKSTTPTEVEVA